MADDTTKQGDFADLLTQITFILQQPVDFNRTDMASTVVKVRLLVAAATYFNVLSVTTYGGRAGPVREHGLLEQAVTAAFQTFSDAEPHPDPFDKAAMLLRGITQGHPFTDGNKRTGFLVASYYLEQVGHPAPARIPVDQAEALCLRVSAGHLRDVAAIAGELRRLWGMPPRP